MPNFPAPRADELLYSVIARAAVHLGYWSPKGLLEAVYEDRSMLACPDLPVGVARIARVSHGTWGLTLQELATRHTLLGYYIHFLPSAARTKALERMLQRSGHLHVRLGICTGGVVRTPFFRLCRACSEDDVMRHGETYWRRSHHLPGVVVCAIHGDPLLETCVPFRPIGRHEHVCAHPDHLARAVPVLAEMREPDFALAIARESARLLDAPSSAPSDYRGMLRLQGFVGRQGGLQRFREAVRAIIPRSLLSAMFTSLDADGLPSWLDSIRRKPRRALHPLKHVLVRVLLDALSKPIPPIALPKVREDRRGKSADPALRRRATQLAERGMAVRAIASELQVAWKTADRLLKPIPQHATAVNDLARRADRESWTALRKAFLGATRTQLRVKAPALYARLYRADRPWLCAQRCARPLRESKTRIDWGSRDDALAAQVRKVAADLRLRVPPVRVSRSRVLGELQVRSLLAHRRAKLPRTVAVLDECCEKVESFQIRRLAAVMQEQRAPGLVSDAMWLTLTRINIDRLPDRGAALLAAARMVTR